MAAYCSFSHSDYHVMIRLIAFPVVLMLAHVVHGHHVLLVDGQPVLHAVVIAVDNGLCVREENLNQLTRCPAVVALDQGVRQLVVRQRHQRRDAVGDAAVEDLVVEREAGLVGLAVALGEDTAPVDGHTEDVPAHLGEEGDVLLIVMIEVGGLMAGIQCIGIEHLIHLARDAMNAVAARQELDKAKKITSEKYVNAIKQYNHLRNNLDGLQNARNLAAKAYGFSRDRFAAGQTSAVELADVSTGVYQLDMALLNAKYKILMSAESVKKLGE